MKGLLLTPYFLLLIDTPHPALRLLSEPKTLNHTSIAFHVLVLYIVQESSPLADQFQEPSARMMILLMGLEVVRQILYPGAEEGNLDLRGSRILFVQPITVDDSFSLSHV